jgi:cytochrome c biogenesis protein CcmG/thiol:disulfide interchange protein DsbE
MFFRNALLAAAALATLSAACSGGHGKDLGSPNDPPGSVATTAPAIAAPGETGMLEPNRPKIGELAPDFALADARDGTIRKLSDFRGKAVVLNWYASWCGPCKQEIPEFKEANDELASQVSFIGINFKEDAGRALGILDLFYAKYPALLDDRGEVGKHYRVTGLPVTYFLDKDGVIQGIKIGEVKSKDLESNLKKIGIDYTVD